MANIVCYRYQPAGVSNDKLKAINTEIMLRLQEEGTAIISDTTVHGAYCLRAAINNHRTRYDDLTVRLRKVSHGRSGVRSELPSATWIMASDTSSRVS